MRRALLTGEAVAWPLVDPAAFSRPEAPATDLIQGFRERATSLGFTAREGELEVSAVTQACAWSPCHALIPRARLLLNPSGAIATLKMDPEVPGREVLRWRWYGLCLPPLLWIAAATDGHLCPRSEVSLLDRAIAPTHPVAHHHLHAGAAFPFELLWSRLASHLELGRLKRDKEAPALAGGRCVFFRWLVRAFLARRWLAHRLLGIPMFGPDDHELRRPVARALAELERGAALPDEAEPERADAALARFAAGPSRSAEAPRTPGAVWRADPLWRGRACPEAQLLHACLHRREELGLDQTLFAQYLRVKVALFRHLRFDPAESGLPSFVLTYRRISPYKSDLSDTALSVACDEPELPLASVELRTAPEPSVETLLDLVAPRVGGQDGEEVPSVEARVEWGWVLHFLRPVAEDRPDDGQRRSSAFHRRYREHLQRAGVLEQALQTWPQLLSVIRGLDLADDETKGPLWLALPVLKRLRRLSDEIVNSDGRFQPLRLTLHAGEDFAHLLTGLRAVHEPFQWGLLRPGDRLGHAIALGLSVDLWTARREPVGVCRWDRLQDLLWIERACPSLGVLLPKEDHDRIQRECLELASEIWRDRPWGQTGDIDLDALRALQACLGQEDTLQRLRLEAPDGAYELTSPSDRLLHDLLFQSDVQGFAMEEVQVSRELEAGLMSSLQRALRRLVARARVCVELNPSSNLLVAQLETLIDEPAFRLRPTDPARDDLVDVSINADDPISFSTRLADEYAYAWAGMVHGIHDGSSVGPRYATTWLEEAAQTSWRTRFTLPTSRDLAGLPPPGDGDRRWAQVHRA